MNWGSGVDNFSKCVVEFMYMWVHQCQVEKAKQDDALSDLSNILGDLKSMAVDMGGELERSVSIFSSCKTII